MPTASYPTKLTASQEAAFARHAQATCLHPLAQVRLEVVEAWVSFRAVCDACGANVTASWSSSAGIGGEAEAAGRKFARGWLLLAEGE